ncbi:hypothetical protein ACLBWT_07730 [Paenibacillus sp. D51F]
MSMEAHAAHSSLIGEALTDVEILIGGECLLPLLLLLAVRNRTRAYKGRLGAHPSREGEIQGSVSSSIESPEQWRRYSVRHR